MRRYLLPLVVLCLPTLVAAKTGTAMYVCAHPDDCLLFMNPNLYNDVTREADKVVVVYLTSGDAGQPFKQEGSTASYPYVREQASIDATEWMVDAGKETITATLETETADINGHDIERVSYGNTVSYFLRLPDGNFGGEGFPLYQNASLHKLQTGGISQLATIDDSGAYHWRDVVTVISGILTKETGDAKHVALHIQDPDTQANTHDHSDHTVGGAAVLEALAHNKAGRCYTLYKHIDYSIAGKPLNLEGEALQNKAGSFAVLTATQRHFLTHHDWNEAHTSYLGRSYYSAAALPEGCDTTR